MLEEAEDPIAINDGALLDLDGCLAFGGLNPNSVDEVRIIFVGESMMIFACLKSYASKDFSPATSPSDRVVSSGWLIKMNLPRTGRSRSW